MARPTFAPTGRERQFDHHELFFSTTDPKGVILSGNDVFVRVSGYSRAALVGTAHNIIRHPDIPQAVFKLLWDYLDAGKPFAGYVKNMAADGGFYWVVVLVVPIERGFLSVRFKPSTPVLGIVDSVYKQMLAVEKSVGTAPGAWRKGMQLATEFLLGALKSKGFSGYDDFMQTVLAAELASHRALLDRRAAREAGRGQRRDEELAAMLDECASVDLELGGLFSKMGSFLEVIKGLDAKAVFLRDLAANMHLVSLNALIGSCSQGAGGEGFSVVTQDLASLSKDSTATIEVMTKELLTLTSSLRETAFSINAAKLQVEMTSFFLRELVTAGADWEHSENGALIRSDIATLRESFRTSVESIATAVLRASDPIPKLLRMEAELATDLRRISCVRLVGKIHSTGLAGEAHFHEMLDRILEQLGRATTELEELTDGVKHLRDQLPELTASAGRVQGRSCDCHHLLHVAA